MTNTFVAYCRLQIISCIFVFTLFNVGYIDSETVIMLIFAALNAQL